MKFSIKREQNRVNSNSAEREKIGAKLNIFKKIKASLRLCEAVRQADKAHSENGQRYYVMPTSGASGQLIIMDRANFRKLKLKNYVSHNTFVKDLEQECFYCTPYRNGAGELSAEEVILKKKQYFSWLEAIAKSKKKISANENKVKHV